MTEVIGERFVLHERILDQLIGIIATDMTFGF